MKAHLPLLACAPLLAGAVPAFAAETITVRIDGFTCTDSRGESGFDARSFSIGGTDPVYHSSIGIHEGKPKLTDLVIMKGLDGCTDRLLSAFLSGKGLPNVVLTETRQTTGNQTSPFLTITLRGALVDNWQLSDTNTVLPTESISLAYTQFCVSSVSQLPSGQAGPVTTVCYDALLNNVQ